MARDFPGVVGNYLRAAVSSRHDLRAPFTIGVWFMLQAGGFDGYLLGRTENTRVQYHLRYQNLNVLRASCGNGGTTLEIVDTATPSQNVWHHGALRKTGTGAGGLAVYLDGVRTDIANSTLVVGDSTWAVTIGERGDPAQNFNGLLAECALWNVALTNDEVLALAKGVTPTMVRMRDLQGYWPVMGVAAPEGDLSGGALNMALTGTVPVVASHPPVGRWKLTAA